MEPEPEEPELSETVEPMDMQRQLKDFRETLRLNSAGDQPGPDEDHPDAHQFNAAAFENMALSEADDLQAMLKLLPNSLEDLCCPITQELMRAENIFKAVCTAASRGL